MNGGGGGFCALDVVLKRPMPIVRGGVLGGGRVRVRVFWDIPCVYRSVPAGARGHESGVGIGSGLSIWA